MKVDDSVVEGSNHQFRHYQRQYTPIELYDVTEDHNNDDSFESSFNIVDNSPITNYYQQNQQTNHDYFLLFCTFISRFTQLDRKSVV